MLCNLGRKEQSIPADREWSGYSVVLGNYGGGERLPGESRPDREGIDGGMAFGDGLEGGRYVMRPYEFIAFGKDLSEF